MGDRRERERGEGGREPWVFGDGGSPTRLDDELRLLFQHSGPNELADQGISGMGGRTLRRRPTSTRMSFFPMLHWRLLSINIIPDEKRAGISDGRPAHYKQYMLHLFYGA